LAKAKNEERTPVVYAIDPLLAALAHFDTSQDLSDRIQTLFKVLDVDENGGMSYQELKVGLTQLKISPPIVINRDDWDSMTCNDTLTSADGSLTLEAFDAVMRSQLKLYVQRQMANSIQMNSSDGPNQMGTLLFVMKLLMISVDDIQQNLAGRTNSAHPCAAAPCHAPGNPAATQRHDARHFHTDAVCARECSGAAVDAGRPADGGVRSDSGPAAPRDGSHGTEERLGKLEAAVSDIKVACRSSLCHSALCLPRLPSLTLFPSHAACAAHVARLRA